MYISCSHPRPPNVFLIRSFDFLIQLPLPLSAPSAPATRRRGRRRDSTASTPFAFQVAWTITSDDGSDVAVGFATAAHGSPAVASVLSASMPYVPAPPRLIAPSPEPRSPGSRALHFESQCHAKAGFSTIDWRCLDVARPLQLLRPADLAAESGASRGGTLTLSPATRLLVIRFHSHHRARWFSWGVAAQKIRLQLSIEPVH